MEKEVWDKDLDSHPHGKPWHTSFHASSFPGDDPDHCPRLAIYGLMDLPKSAPTSRFLRSAGDAGKNIELELVKRWAWAGLLLSVDQNTGEETQTGFVDEEYWLTGNCDAILLPPRWSRPHVVEVKSKKDEFIAGLKSGFQQADPKHVRQCMTYICFAHEFSQERWPHLDPVISGSLFYVSRDNPAHTHEIYLTYDENFLAAGREKIATYQEAFLAGELPPRPSHFKWSEGQCKFCELKKSVCKPDWKEKIGSLRLSHALPFAQGLRSYSYDEARARVLKRWGAEDTAEEAA